MSFSYANNFATDGCLGTTTPITPSMITMFGNRLTCRTLRILYTFQLFLDRAIGLIDRYVCVRAGSCIGIGD